MASYTFSITSNKPVLRCTLDSSLRLDPHKNWEAALLDFTTFNSIPNISENENNKFHYYKQNPIEKEASAAVTETEIATESTSTVKEIKSRKERAPPVLETVILQTGSYEIEHINKELQKSLGKENISLRANNSLLKCELKSKYYVDLSQEHSIGSLLGYPSDTPILEPNKTHTSTNPVDIIKVNSLNITCNLIEGSYIDGIDRHILHTFYPTVPPGFKIVEKPHNLVYLPLNTSYISDIVLNVLDQDGNFVDFRGELITLRLHVRAYI